jgi:hypothetical protein
MEKTWKCANLKEDRMSWIIDTEVVIIDWGNILNTVMFAEILFNFVFFKFRYGLFKKKTFIFNISTTNAV